MGQKGATLVSVLFILLSCATTQIGAQQLDCFITAVDCTGTNPVMTSDIDACCNGNSGASVLQQGICVICTDHAIDFTAGTGTTDPTKVNEEGMVTLSYTISPNTDPSPIPPVILPPVTTFTVTVNPGGTADETDDFTISITSASPASPDPDGVFILEINVNALDDVFLEGLEFFTFTIGADTGGVSLPANSFTVNICDDPDFAEIKIELESPNSAIGNLFPEDDSTGVSFCAVIDGDPGLMNLMAITVSVDIELDTAEPEDINILTTEITIPANSLTQCEDLFDIVDDDYFEFIETFNVSINSTSIDPSPDPCTLPFGIVDPEDLTVEFDRAVYVVEEGSCFMPAVRVSITNGSMGHECITVTGTVAPGDGKAGAGANETNSTTLTFDLVADFSSGAVFPSIEAMCLLDNTDLHGNITFILQLDSYPLIYTLGAQSTATVVFDDNDDDGPALVTLTIDPGTVNEGNSFTICGEVIFAGIIRNLSVHFPILPVILTRDGIFSGEAADIINLDAAYLEFECFSEGNMACTTLTTDGNDNLVEYNELIGFELGESSNVPGAVAHGNTVELIILDNDVVSARLSITSDQKIEVDECGNNFVEVCVELILNPTTMIGNPFTVQLTAADVYNAATLGLDYEFGIVPQQGCPLSPFNSGAVPPNAPSGPSPTATSLLIPFEEGSVLEFCGFVTILDDNIYEDKEEIILTIDSTSPFTVARASVMPPDSTTIHINKDKRDAVLSLLNIESFIADEGDLLQACFILVTEVDIECDIEAFLTAESDASITVNNIQFPAGSAPGTFQCFNISILEDDWLEDHEVVLFEASSDDAIISSLFDQIFNVIDFLGSLGDILRALLTCIKEVGGDIEAIVRCVKRIVSHVPYSDDDDIHRNSTMFPLLVKDGDADGVTVGFDTATAAVVQSEDDGDIVISVSLMELGEVVLDVPLTVCISVEDDKSGMVTDRTVDIPALEISEDFTFQILNDDAFGPTIVYTLTIKSSDPPVVPGPIDVFTITIEEDEDLEVGLLNMTVTVCEGDPEGDSDGDVCIGLSDVPADGIACDVVVTLSLIQDTAMSDVDFNSEPIMLTIPVGETEVCFDAQSIIIDDYVVEGTERFYVNILAVDPPEVTILPPQTEVLIEDKDRTKVEFEDLEVTLVENGMTYINITFDRTLEKPIFVNYSLSNIVDSENNEGPLFGHLVIGPNASPSNPIDSDVAQFHIDMDADGIKEATEAFALGLESSDECVHLGRDLAIAITPQNGNVSVIVDAPAHQFVNESDGVVVICVEVVSPFQSTFEVLVNTEDITAIGGEDFKSIENKVLIFAPGFPVRCVHIPILPDDCLEQTEIFNVTVSAEHPGVQFANDEVAVYIVEDDYTKVGFEDLEYPVVEGENTTVCITFDKKLEKDITVKYSLESSTEDNNEDDQCGVLVISGSRESPLESGRVCFNISIREDMYKEGEELFTLTLETNDSCVWLGRDGALLRVEENGAVNVTITPDGDIEVLESDGFVEICVQASRQSQTTYEVDISTEDVTATAGADYVGIDKSLLFSFGFDLTQCVHIPILPDDCLELTESFRVSLSASHNGIDFIVDEITVFILEDDVVKVGFEQLLYTAQENETMEICVALDKKLEKPIELTYTLGNGFLSIVEVNEQDQTNPLTIGANATPGNPFQDEVFCFNIRVPDDMIKEGRESFGLFLGSDDDCVCLARDGAIVFVESNGEVTISVMPDFHIQVNEDVGAVKICLEADHAIQVSFAVTVVSQDVTAIAGEDYVAIDKAVVFAFGFAIIQCIHIPILSDDCFEDFMQSFNISLSSSHEDVVFDVDEFPVYILDDDPVYVSFEETFLYVNESEVVDVCLVLGNATEPTKDSLTVQVSSAMGSASDPSDYDAVDTSVTFDIGSTTGDRSCFQLSINGDDAFEKVENFSLHIEDVVAENVFVHIKYLNVFIHEDSAAYISFNETSLTVDENQGVLSVCVEISNLGEPTQAEIWADITSTPNSPMPLPPNPATPGSDFVDVAATVVFPPGSDNGDVECFGVTIMNDMAFEKDEYFTLHFSAVEEGVEIHEAYLSIHILDDDAVNISFTAESMTVPESQGTLSICLELDQVIEPTEDQIWANVSSEESSATAGSDFVSVEETLIFPPGSVNGENGMVACVPVTIEPNDAFEKSEYFTLVIVAVEDNVNIVIGVITIHITDDDTVSLLFTEDNYFAVEPMILTVCVGLSGALDVTEVPIWANISTCPGSATADDGDYVAADEALFLPAGSNNGDQVCLDISILNDGVDEEQEMFSVKAALEDGVSPSDVEAAVAIGICEPVFTGGTPRVDGTICTVTLPDCVTEATLSFPNSPDVEYTGPETEIVIPRATLQRLTVTVTSPVNVVFSRNVRSDISSRCDSHLLNTGISKLDNGNYLLEFEGTGPSTMAPIDTFDCTVLDGTIPPVVQNCSPPSFEFTVSPDAIEFMVQVAPDPDENSPEFSCFRPQTRVYSP